MAQLISNADTRYLPDVPFHTEALAQVGTDVSGAKKAEEALATAGLAGWNVQKVPLWADLRNYPGPERGVALKEQFATVRVDPKTNSTQALAVVGKNYKIVQNEEHAAFLDAVVDQSGGTYEQAASLKGGKLVYVSIKLPDYLLVGGRDPVNLYLNGINSFDGSTHFMLNVDAVRAWCSNQLNYFRRNSFKIRHSGDGLEGKVQAAREALALTFKEVDAFAREAEELIQVSLTDRKFQQIVEELYPQPEDYGKADKARTTNNYDRLREGLTQAWQGPANANVRGTAWGGLQAVVEYLDHYKGGDEGRGERILTSDSLITQKEVAEGKFLSLLN